MNGWHLEWLFGERFLLLIHKDAVLVSGGKPCWKSSSTGTRVL
jgi:hypothetical protein